MTDANGELGPTIDELVRIAREAGKPQASRRTIRHWISRGLVSRPARSGRHWLYPNRAIGEVDAVTRWRKQGATIDQARFAAFIETGGGSWRAAVAFASQFLDAWEQAVEAAAEGVGADPAVLEGEAAKAARMRGRGPLPHRVRGVSLDQRTLAITFVISEMLGAAPRDPDTAAAGLFHLERILGLRSGRGGADRDLTGITVEPAELAADPAELRRGIGRASSERIEFARRGVDFAVVWLPALRATLAAQLGAASAPVIDIIAEWAEKLTPDVYALLFATFVRNGLERATDEQIKAALSVFSAPLVAAAILGGRPPNERELALRRVRPYQRMLFERAPRHHR